MDIIRVKQLGFSYTSDRSEDHPVLKDLNLNVRRGEVLAVLGPSGCGKSTLIKLMAGFLKTGEGEIYHKDTIIGKPNLTGQMIFQDTNQLLPWLNVEENIIFPHKKKQADAAWTRELLEMVGLKEYASYYPYQLSGGMKQRCAMARALYVSPEIIFMDEPFVSLDAPSRNKLQDLVLDLWERSETTIVFVTHDIGEALYLADRILILDGKKKQPLLMDNRLARPRERWDETFLKEVMKIHSLVETSLGIR